MQTSKRCLFIVVMNNFSRYLLGICLMIIILHLYLDSFPLINPVRTSRLGLRLGFKSQDIELTSSSKVILFWNKYFTKPHWDFRSSVVDLQCGNYECVITDKHDFLHSVDEYDALIFHAAQRFEIPPKRDPKQLYIFALREAPYATPHFNIDNFYNLTMHYRFDADIFWPYLQVIDAKSGEYVAPAYNPKWRNSSYFHNFVPSFSFREQLKRKTKSAAWFVSHCKTQSRREKLVQELQKYIKIDIYGKCGNLSCSHQNQKLCNEMLVRDYKFYLSFENALCTDYTTEKIMRGLKQTVIPIVFGGANYSRFVPPKSYINVEDFKTVEELGMFLSKLEQNITEYAKYFWWKKFYSIRWYSTPKACCELCSQLHDKTLKPTIRTYRSIEKYWFPSCRNKSIIKF